LAKLDNAESESSAGSVPKAKTRIRSVALAHIGELESRAAELRCMTKTLRTLVRACEGDHRPNCPIIEELVATKPRQQRRRTDSSGEKH
jgi:hypothetical protein